MNEVQKSLRDYVDMHNKIISEHYKHAQDENNMYVRLDKEGKFFQVPRHRPSQYPLLQIKNCFQNSFDMMLNHPELEYAEGVAYSGVIPVHHAWNLDKDGKIVDTTWRTRGKWAKYSTGREYLGIVIPREEIIKVICTTRTYGYWK